MAIRNRINTPQTLASSVPADQLRDRLDLALNQIKSLRERRLHDEEERIHLEKEITQNKDRAKLDDDEKDLIIAELEMDVVGLRAQREADLQELEKMSFAVGEVNWKLHEANTKLDKTNAELDKVKEELNYALEDNFDLQKERADLQAKLDEKCRVAYSASTLHDTRRQLLNALSEKFELEGKCERLQAQLHPRTYRIEQGNKLLNMLIMCMKTSMYASRQIEAQSQRETKLDAREAELHDRELVMQRLINNIRDTYLVDVPVLYNELREIYISNEIRKARLAADLAEKKLARHVVEAQEHDNFGRNMAGMLRSVTFDDEQSVVEWLGEIDEWYGRGWRDLVDSNNEEEEMESSPVVLEITKSRSRSRSVDGERRFW